MVAFLVFEFPVSLAVPEQIEKLGAQRFGCSGLGRQEPHPTRKSTGKVRPESYQNPAAVCCRGVISSYAFV